MTETIKLPNYYEPDWGNARYGSLEELKELLNDKYVYSHHPALAAIKANIAQEEKKQAIIGKDFIDLTLNDTNGVSHKLSDYVGKGNYMLLDFWASFSM